MEKGIQTKMKACGSKIERGIAFLVYSDPGVGKTTMSATLPVGETLIINAESGLGPLLGTEHIVFNLSSSDPLATLDKLYKFLRTEQHPFKYVVLDNISEIEQWIVATITKMRNKEFTEIREWGDSASKMREQLHLWRDLREQGITVVFNAWEMTLEMKQDAGMIRTKTFPKLSKKLAPDVCGLVDVVGHLEVHEKSGKRWLRIGPSDQYLTKSQFQGLDDGEEANLPIILQKIYDYDYSIRAPREEDGDVEQKS